MTKYYVMCDFTAMSLKIQSLGCSTPFGK